jgi:hypothetical protein
MIERIIYLDDINPVHFFGPNNSLLDRLTGLFPKIKIMVRAMS